MSTNSGSTSAAARCVVAVDGPSGSGKSTVSRRVAQRLGLRYLDTGAMYRAITWEVLRRQLELEPALLGLVLTADELDRMELEVGTDPRRAAVRIAGHDVATAIRGEEVTSAVSIVSAVPQVRRWLVTRQRELIGAGRIVVEGRDIGTTVVPTAEVKVFLTASGSARAARRHREAVEDGAVERTEAALARRDALDSTRATSPLARAADAVEIDSTDLGVAEVVSAVLARCAAAGLTGAAGPSPGRGL
ncbi:MAG TPA: (d)CMP kinase [Mycobacteriales bacterium]|nr:(d)CMP kinase [Mycobacteriales bacterium]